MRKNCANCLYMIEEDFIQMENREIIYIKENLSCRSQNVIYVMFCAGCDAMYIGETGQPFNKRMDSHRLHINRQEYLQSATTSSTAPELKTSLSSFGHVPFSKCL